MIEAGRYRKKPVVIDAVHWDGTEECMKVIFELVDFDTLPSDDVHVNKGLGYTPGIGTLDIPTFEGTMTAMPGDWIIRGVKGEIYPCKPDIFEAIYEPEVTGDFITIGPECFSNKEGTVINWKGENYYKACDAFVSGDPDGAAIYCVKRIGHPSNVHEAFNGETNG